MTLRNVRKFKEDQANLDTHLPSAKTSRRQRRVAHSNGGRLSSASSFASRGRQKVYESFRSKVISLNGLSQDIRRLAVLGYVIVLGMLVATLLLELVGDQLESVTFRPDSSTGRVQIPILAIIVSNISFVLGWAFLLTGASDCRRRVFLPVVFVFLFQLFLLAIGLGDNRNLIFAFWSLAIPLVALPVGLHFFTRRSVRWREHPMLEFAAWGAAMSVFVIFLWVARATTADVALAVHSTFLVVLLLSVPYWVLLGFGVVDMSADLARPVSTKSLRQ